jgi:hypothetical protein
MDQTKMNFFEVKSFPELKKPKDQHNRHVAWVLCFQAPGLHYHGRWVDISTPVMEKIVANYKKMTRKGYSPPLIAQHNSPNGERLGDILDIRMVTIENTDCIVCAVAFNDKDAEQKIKDQKIKYFSPSLEEISLEDGSVILAITELSQTDRPYQKNAKTHILANEMEKKNMLDAEQLNAMLLAFKAQLKSDLEAMLAAKDAAKMEEEVPTEEEEVVEEVEKEEEVSLTEKLKKENQALKLKAFKAENPKLASMSDEVVKSILSLSEKGKNELLKAINGNVTKVVKPSQTEQGVSLSEKPLAKSSGPISIDECLKIVGGDAKKAYELYKERRGV